MRSTTTHQRKVDHLIRLLQRTDELTFTVKFKNGEKIYFADDLDSLYEAVKKADNDAFTSFMEQTRKEEE